MYPFGILSGIFAIFVLLKIVGAVLGEFLFEGINGILFSVNIIGIIVSVILGFITIYLSAFVSSRKASKVTPISLLRNSEEIKINPRKLKTPIVIKKVFRTGGVLAYKNLKRSKKKYRTTVISIAVSICIFITMSAFINNMFDFSSSYYTDYEYNVNVSFTSNTREESANKVMQLDNIDEHFITYIIDENSYLEIRDQSKLKDAMPHETDKETGEKFIGMSIYGLDSTSFKKYVKKANLNYSKVKNKGILLDTYNLYDEKNNTTRKTRVYNYEEGDNIVGKLGENDLTIEVRSCYIRKTVWN